MIRTQVYLSEENRKYISQIAKSTGKNASEIVREAIDKFASSIADDEKKNQDKMRKILKKASGMWKNNKFDFDSLRKSADRKFDNE